MALSNDSEMPSSGIVESVDKEVPQILPNSIQILSDIHLEFTGTFDKMKKIRKGSKVLALLGDIGYPWKDEYKQFIKDMSQLFEYVIIIAGNHEYYQKEFFETNVLIQSIADQYSNVYFLNNSILDLPDCILGPNIRILGTTMWIDYPKDATIMFEYKINDFRRIKIKESLLKQTYFDSIDTNSNGNCSNDNILTKEEKCDNIDNDKETPLTPITINSNNENEKSNEKELKTAKSEKIDNYNTDNIDSIDKSEINYTKQNNGSKIEAISTIESKNEIECQESKNEKKKDIAQLLSCQHINQIHFHNVKWVTDQLLIAEKENKKVIVLTHHAPTDYLCVSNLARDDLIVFGTNYANMEHLFKLPLIGWFSGHTHNNCDYYVKSNNNGNEWFTRIASNQQGYLPINRIAKDYTDCKVVSFDTDLTMTSKNIDTNIPIIDFNTLLNEKMTSKVGLVPKKLYDLKQLNILGDNDDNNKNGTAKTDNTKTNGGNNGPNNWKTPNCHLM